MELSTSLLVTHGARARRLRGGWPWTLLALLAGSAALAAPETGEELSVPEKAYVARMAQEHAGDRPVASEAATLEPRQAVRSEAVTYATLDDEAVAGYLAVPEAAGAPLPGLIVIQEWWGLNDNIEAMTRRLAGEGYLALAVDLYGGQVAETRDQAMALMRQTMGNRARAEDNLRQAHRYLKENHKASQVGVIGWCFGGMWSLNTALLLGDEIAASVIYYGRLTSDKEQLAKLKAPILGLFGSQDRGIPVASVRNFEAALKSLGKEVAIKIYEGADHAFANPSGTRYSAEAAEDAWQRTVLFLAQRLRPEGSPAE